MSHKTELKTELNNKEYLLQALKKLGFAYSEAKEGQVLMTKGHYGVREKVDILIHEQDDAVGFKQNADGTFTAIGDFYGLRKNGQYFTAEDMKCETTALSKECQMAEHLMNIGFAEAAGRKETKDYIEVTYERYV